MAKKKTHYETIGVDPSASPADIRNAYRAKAKQLHPDKAKQGEDTQEEFKSLALAYSVLSNAQARKHYDSTGLDNLSTLEQDARNCLLEAFSQALVNDFDRCFKYTAKYLQGKRDERKLEIKQCQAELRKLEKKQGKIKLKSKGKAKENFFEILLAQGISRMQEGLEDCKKRLEVIEAAIKLLDEYESLEQDDLAASFSSNTTATMRIRNINDMFR